MKSALISDAKSAADQTSVCNIAAIDPTSGATFVMAYAEAKARGLLAANVAGPRRLCRLQQQCPLHV